MKNMNTSLPMNPSSPHYNENVMYHYRNFPNLKEKLKSPVPKHLLRKLASHVKLMSHTKHTNIKQVLPTIVI